METGKSTLPLQREKVSMMPSKTTPSDNDGDEKGFMKLRYKGGKSKKKC